MSVVAVKVSKDEIVIGADSIQVRGYTQQKDKRAKLGEIRDGFIIGSVGYARDGALLREYAKTREPKDASVDSIVEYFSEFHNWMLKKRNNDKNVKITDSVYIIVFDGKAFMFHDYYVKEIIDYDAIGAGMDYALSALYLGESVESAIKTACELSIYCEAPIKTFSVLTKNDTK